MSRSRGSSMWRICCWWSCDQIWAGRGSKYGSAGLVDETTHQESREGTGNKTAQNAYPVKTVVPKNVSIDFTNICMRKLQCTCIFSKVFLYSVFFKPSQPTYTHCLFLPLKMMSCMSHFGTLHRKKMIMFFCFSAQAVNFTWICTNVLFYVSFFCFLQSEVSVNAQEQTSSTRL